MTFQHIQRKLYNLTHPVVGEVWMLHRVVEQRSDKPEQRELEVTPQWLETQIADRQRDGWRFVSLDEMDNRGRWIVLTIDDGYTDTYSTAYPLFRRLGVPFAVYVTTGFLDNRSGMWWYHGQQLGLDTQELRVLDADPLCTIGAHTVSHPRLDTLTREQQLAEIEGSKNELERLLGHSVRHFSFPHGAHNDDSIDICRQLGFSTSMQSWGGPVRKGASRMELPRINKP